MAIPVSNAPSQSDSAIISAMKINALMAQLYNMPDLKPSRGDSLEMSFRKINQILFAASGGVNPTSLDQYVPLNGSANLQQVALLSLLDDPSQPGVDGSLMEFRDQAGSGQTLVLSTKYIGWRCAGGSPRTCIFVDSSGELYAQQIDGPNAGKKADLTRNNWR